MEADIGGGGAVPSELSVFGATEKVT